jgi:hypothetical protein
MDIHIGISLFEPAVYILGLVCYLAAKTVYGKKEAGLFFLGVVIVAGFNEHVTTFLGNYNYFWQLPRDMHYFSKYTESLGGNWAWIGVLPGYFFPAWFMACMFAYTVSKGLFPNARPLFTAFVTGALVTVNGLVAENLGQINQWWQYTSVGRSFTFWDGVWGGVFVYYMCWIGSMVLVFEKTLVTKEGFRWLKGIESALFKEESEIKIYCFRLGVFSILSSAATHIFDYIILRPLA